MKLQVMSLLLLVGFLGSVSAYSFEKHPRSLDNKKVAKVIEKAGFYHGLHATGYIFGTKGEKGEVLSVNNLTGWRKIEATYNRFFTRLNNLTRSKSMTKEVTILSRLDGESKLVTCTAFIQHSVTTPSSPQVLANVKQYDCEDENGYAEKDFEFSYTRLEVSLIAAGRD